MAYSPYNPNRPTADQIAMQDPAAMSFAPSRSGNPIVTGYEGYPGYGPSPYQFSYGSYGFGSYGYEPGDADQGYSNPKPLRFFDTVGRPQGR